MLTLIDIVLVVLTVLIAIVPLFKEVSVQKETQYKSQFILKINQRKKGFKRHITFPGKVVIGMALAIIIFGILRYSVSNIEKENSEKKNKADLTEIFNSVLKDYNIKIDPTTGKVSNDTVVIISKEKVQKPFLNIFDKPRFLTSLRDNGYVPVEILVKNLGKGIAKNINAQIAGVIETDDNKFILSNDAITNDPDHKFPSRKGLYVYQARYKYIDPDTYMIAPNKTYMFFKISYTDEVGQIQPTIRVIYHLNYPNIVLASTLKIKQIRQILEDFDIWY